MQIKEFEALTLKECLQQVRDAMGPEAVILETRKARKGGMLGMGSREAVCIVAATGITVQNDLPAAAPRRESDETAVRAVVTAPEKPRRAETGTVGQAAAVAAARNAYTSVAKAEPALAAKKTAPEPVTNRTRATAPPSRRETAPEIPAPAARPAAEPDRFASLERAMQEIREGLNALRQQQEAQERKITSVVSASATIAEPTRPLVEVEDTAIEPRFPELHQRLVASGMASDLANDLLDSLPNFEAWSVGAQGPLAESALRELISRRVPCAGPIQLVPGQLKAIAMVGPTGVGKTTTIAKLAAHFSLVEGKKVALLTVDTYRIAAVEQLKTYSQIIDIPIGVAYNQAEVLPAVEQFRDYDLLLIDTAGRSQKNIMQVGELKALLEAVHCETHLVLSALIKEQDMLEAASRFSAARVDRILFSKLDETSTYGTLFSVADQTGIPLSYLTTGQKVPEDIETADGRRLADLILGAN